MVKFSCAHVLRIGKVTVMPVKTLDLNGLWKLTDMPHQPGFAETMHRPDTSHNQWMDAHVPGDIHDALMGCGRMPDPGVGMNLEECRWTRYTDWWYRREVFIPAGFGGEKVELVFDGIDTYGTVFVNGHYAGAADNMFRPWRFDVTALMAPEQMNVVIVCIKGPSAILEKRDASRYYACFYLNRVWARKAQCHFSWDWAPNLPAIGLWRGVRLEAVSDGRIEDVHIRTRIDGTVLINVETDQYGKRREGSLDTLEIAVIRGMKTVRKEVSVQGAANPVVLNVPDPKLWWPLGYGKQNLYECRVAYLRDGAILDTWSGHFGIREIVLEEEPAGDGRFGFAFRVNGVKIFCQGANWVPADYLSGRVTDERIHHLLRLCAEAGFNTLRVWGGGVYESDAFYGRCDELGILIWQDLMFACSDIPDDDPGFVTSLIPEFESQVKRLRNHPCILHWCGGNEKTGTFRAMTAYGDTVTRYLARGVLAQLCPDASYTPSSPHALTDVGNDSSSGDSHTGNPFEQVYPGRIEQFREVIRDSHVSFNSEFAGNGPCCLRSIRKFIPAESLWPLNEVWEAHVQDNPYNEQDDTFLQMQRRIAESLFRAPYSAADFVKLAGTVHALVIEENMRAQRAHFPETAGALLWMFNDTWPCASWSLVDYFGMPKQGYYAARRACAPVIVDITRGSGELEVRVVNGLTDKVRGRLTVEVCRVSGELIHHARERLKVGAQSTKVGLSLKADRVPAESDVFVHAMFKYDDHRAEQVWFPNRWKGVGWPMPEIEMTAGPCEQRDDGLYCASLTVATRHFARCVYLVTEEDVPAWFSDNYFDMTPNETREIIVSSAQPFLSERIRLHHWLTEWED
jgi:beta-mannosidase